MQIFCELPVRWQETGDPGRQSARWWAKFQLLHCVWMDRWCEGASASCLWNRTRCENTSCGFDIWNQKDVWKHATNFHLFSFVLSYIIHILFVINLSHHCRVYCRCRVLFILQVTLSLCPSHSWVTRRFQIPLFVVWMPVTDIERGRRLW